MELVDYPVVRKVLEWGDKPLLNRKTPLIKDLLTFPVDLTISSEEV